MYIALLLLDAGHIQTETCCSFNKTDVVFKLCAELFVQFQGVISGTQWTLAYIQIIRSTTGSISPFNAKWCASELDRNKKYPKFASCMINSLFSPSPFGRHVDQPRSECSRSLISGRSAALHQGAPVLYEISWPYRTRAWRLERYRQTFIWDKILSKWLNLTYQLMHFYIL